jgi:hypothetical protein
MKKLSDQLSDLADRTKHTEDTVAALRAKNRAALDQEKARVQASIADSKTQAEDRLATAKENTDDWWSGVRSSVESRLSAMHEAVEQRRAERDVARAQHRADRAEQDAADAIDLALFMLDEAEYAVIDAALARADADELAMQA